MKRNKIWGWPAVAGLLSFSQFSLAGIPGPVVSWEPVASTAVPTLGTWALLMLSMLIAVIALRTWREAPTVLRSILLVAAAGLSGGSLLWSDDVKSGVVSEVFTGAGCEGSITVENGSTGLVNNCGQTVVLTVGSCPEGEVKTSALDDNWAETGDLLEDGSQVALPYCRPETLLIEISE